MAKTTKTEEQLKAEASQAEMKAKRDEITAYYKDSISHLKVQKEYETLLKEIETARAERVQAQTFLANAMAQQQQAQQAPPPTPSGIKGQDVVGTDWDASSDKAPPVRKLKTVE